MTVARSVADVLDDHTVFEIECIDRMYGNVFVPQLQYAAGLVGFVHRRSWLPIASTAPLGRISDRFTAGIRRYARDHDVAWVDFVRGERKDDVMRQRLASFTAEEGVVFIGRARRRNSVFRTERRRNPTTGATYPWIVKSTGVTNRFYVYAVDADFGPFFPKFSSYFPYDAKLWVLTELGGESSQFRGQVPAGVGTVPARDRIGRAATGSCCVGGGAVGSAEGDRGAVRALPAA